MPIFDKVKKFVFANSEKKPPEIQGTLWQKRISAANKYFEKWERQFKCKTMNEYYEGKQWKGVEGYDPYTVNLIYSSIQVKQPSLLFAQPEFHLKPKPGKSDFNPQEAFVSCQLQEDTLNSLVMDKLNSFAEETHFAILDSWSYFGLIEVGYSADWIMNPNAGKPILKSDYDQDFNIEDVEELKQPDQIPEKEYIYVKRIPAHQFRVGGVDSVFLHRNNWVGYYEFVRTQDLVAAGASKDDLEFAGAHSEEFYFDDAEDNLAKSGDLVKIWKIWDLRAKEFIIVKDSPSKILFKPKKFKRLPLFDLRFSKRRKGWYPLPPVFNWKSPQDEINESHEMNRAHRRKARSLYQMVNDMADEDEVNKMMTAPDMTVISVKTKDAITPIQNPTQDASLGISLQVGKDDFNIVSATSADQQGAADRETATAAQIKQSTSQIRTSTDQQVVAKWLCAIGTEVVLQIREKFTLPFWIKLNAGLENQNPDQIKEITDTFKLIHAEDLGDTDFDCNISIESLSPVTNDDEKKKLLEFLAVLAQYPMLASVPDLVYEVAYRLGYRNRKVIQQLARMAQLNLMIQMSNLSAQAAQVTGGQAGPQAPGAPVNGPQQQAPQNMVQNQTPPQLNQIAAQLQNQLQGK